MGPTPIILYEYQKKGVTEISFRKSLILKDAILVVSDLGERDDCCSKKESGSKLPDSKRSFIHG